MRFIIAATTSGFAAARFVVSPGSAFLKGGRSGRPEIHKSQARPKPFWNLLLGAFAENAKATGVLYFRRLSQNASIAFVRRLAIEVLVRESSYRLKYHIL